MKYLNLVIFCICISFFSCSKKKAPISQSNIVYINGKQYPTVVIGGQTWTAGNYDGDKDGSYQDGGLVYKNGTDTASHGLLYTTTEAEAIPLPAGWRVPTENDCRNLLLAVGATEPANVFQQDNDPQSVKALMSTTGWFNGSGSNASGFNLIPIGFYGYGYNAQPSFQEASIQALFITSSTYNGNILWFDLTGYYSGVAAGLNSFIVQPLDRASVRFVKDN